MTMLLAYLAAKGDALGYGVLLGAIITICWLYPPSRLEKPTATQPTTSSRKAGRVRVDGGCPMILAGTLSQTPTLDQMRRNVRALGVMTEILGLSVDQVTARFYVRGGMDHRFTEPDQVDDYLRVLNLIPGDRGAAARNAFLRGWAEHNSVPAPPVVWHRFIGDTAIQVHPETQR